MVSVFTPESRGVHPGRGTLLAFACDTVSCHLRGFSARRRLAAPAECWKRHLAGETGHLRPFSPARCRLQPVRQAPPRGRGDSYWQPAVPPGDGGATSRGAPFRAEMGTFLFWAVHWGMSDGCIVGFARLVYCCYCLTDLSKLFCGTYNIYIFVWWYGTCTVFRPDKVKWCISSMMCSWKLLKFIVKRCIWCEIKFCGKKRKYG